VFLYQKKLFIIILYVFWTLDTLSAQTQSPIDTINIKISEAEKTFVENNLQILAGKYGIKAAQAAITQAELWSNPNISIGQI